MKRLGSPTYVSPIKKLRLAEENRAPRNAKCPNDAIDELFRAAIYAWFNLREILEMNLLPIEDIGSVIMSFYSTYSCVECSVYVILQKNRYFTDICVACYNLYNTSNGILCRYCGVYTKDKCASCKYAQCKVHSMFMVDMTRCVECDYLICKNCIGIEGHHGVLEDGDGEEIHFCYNCYTQHV